MKNFETLLPSGFHPNHGKVLKQSLNEANIKYYFEENIFGWYSLIMNLPKNKANDGNFMFQVGRLIGGAIAIDTVKR